MKTLDQLAAQNGADKASTDYIHEQGHTVKGHDYARHYDSAFSSLRNADIKIVEIGVGSAESIKMWLAFFPNAQVHGVDIVHNTNEWNSESKKPHPRYTFTTGDQGNEAFWNGFIARHGSGWDICCDDGSHANKDIIVTFRAIWPHIKPGGYYAIEDLNCGYSGMEFFLKPGFPNHMEFIANMLHEINHSRDGIDEMRYSKELCILRKKA